MGRCLVSVHGKVQFSSYRGYSLGFQLETSYPPMLPQIPAELHLGQVRTDLGHLYGASAEQDGF